MQISFTLIWIFMSYINRRYDVYHSIYMTSIRICTNKMTEVNEYQPQKYFRGYISVSRSLFLALNAGYDRIYDDYKCQSSCI
jgi:hypothetical protein